MDTIAILGAGGVGGFVAVALARAGAAEVTVIAREPTAQTIARDGLRLDSDRLGAFTAHPAVATALERPADALLIAVKATALEEALQRVRAAPRLVVPLLNGVDHLTVLRERFAGVVAATIRVEADRPAPGVIVQRGQEALIDLAGDEGAELATALRDAGLDAATGGLQADVMWSKLSRLCPLALTTSASDRTLGSVRCDPRWRSALENAIAETAAAGHAEGAAISAQDALRELERSPADNGSSMQRDLRAGRAPELDAIAGAVIRAAQRHDLPCPTVQWLAERVSLRASAAGGAGQS
jgi:2-dehydropantoate 2-reductase